MNPRASTPSRPSSILALLLLAGALSAAACGGGDSASSTSSPAAGPELAFHGKSDLFPGFSYATGLQPAGSPVQASFTLGANGDVKVDATATPSGSASAPELTGLPGTGDLELHGGFTFAGELKVAIAGLPSYDGPIPGIENLKIAIDGQQKFDPFAMKSPAQLHAAIPAKKLPPIPLPGGIPGNLVLSIVDGSFVELDLSGTCAGIQGSDATYVAHVDRAGTLILQPEIDIDFPGVQPVVLPNVTVDLALGGSDFVMDAKVDGYASEAPKGETSTVACHGANGAGGASSETGSGGAGGSTKSGEGGSTGPGPTASSSGAGAGGPSSSSSSGSSSSSSSSSSASSSSGGGGGDACVAHDNDLNACDADIQHCAYFLCSRTCWPFGTPLSVGCGHGLECDEANALSDVRGDEGNDVDTAQGHSTQWYKFKLNEVSNGINSLRYTVTLTEPSDAHYELYVYEGDASQAGCGATPTQGTGTSPSVIRTIADQIVSDQSRYVSIEVRHVSGTPGANWHLTVQGNFAPTCTNDGTCTANDDCVCPDCRNDVLCNDPQSCNHDGICDTYNEGCSCSDCAAAPICH